MFSTWIILGNFAAGIFMHIDLANVRAW